MAKSAREAALTVLERCRRKQAFSDTMLSSVMDDCGLDRKDRGLCAKLTYGVLQNMLLCDFYIDRVLTGNIKLEPKVRDILRLSAYQILFLDKIPDHAAVSQAVELCKKYANPKAAGLVNAVLRRLADQKDKLPQVPKGKGREYLSIKYSTPLPLVEFFCADYGEDFTEKLLQANNIPANMTIQVNTLKTTTEQLMAAFEARDISCRSHEFLPDCVEITGSGDIFGLEEYQSGWFYVQDAAARIAVLASAVKPGDTVLDACSAPGGKSFTAAVMMENSGKIISRDIRKNKLNLIRESGQLLGISILDVDVMDASRPDSDLKEACDVVLADVPCSGLGVIRKKPDIRYKDLAELVGLPDIQLSILEGLAVCVKDGGVLLYSTCTVLKRENDGVIDRFLAGHSEFSTEDFSIPATDICSENGRLSLFSHLHGTDGFYICKLRKHNEN